MPPTITFDELVRYTNGEREKWRRWLAEHPTALDVTVQAQVLELLYWSEEPGFFDLIRVLAATPVGAREQLQRFLDAAPSIELVRAAAEGRDRLVLSVAEEKSVAGLRRTAKVASNA